MPLDKRRLLDFLEVIDKELSRKIKLVAAGGTALTLLDVKPSTIDVDFTMPSHDYGEFKRVLDMVPHGFKVDVWTDGIVFSQILPDNYLERARSVKTRFKHIELKALHPVDIIATKIGRLDERDLEDIDSCIKKFRITRQQIAERAARVQYVGNEENYQINLKHVINRFFGKKSVK